jgi:ankyrin repeat protein
LIHKGADVNLIDKDGDSPILIAAQFQPTVVGALFNVGADAARANKLGQHAHQLMDRRVDPEIHNKMEILVNERFGKRPRVMQTEFS